MNTESGRSLVEMLGVLAVMGILSVAGMSAFKSAMNRHRANELLYEASKRATVAAMQFASGKEIASLAEFTQNDFGYRFNTETAVGDNENQFKITLTAPDIVICTQVKNMLGTASQIRKINSNCTEISFNKDLSSTPYPSDFNGSKENCEKNKDFKYCLANNTCVISTEKCYCFHHDINECGENMYCDFGDSNEKGRCQNLPTIKKTSILKIADGTPTTVYYYGDGNYWSAMSLCKSAEKELVVPEDFGFIDFDNTTCSGSDCLMSCPCGGNGDECLDEEGCISNVCNCWEYLKQNYLNGYYWTSVHARPDTAFNIGIFVSKLITTGCHQVGAHVGYNKILCK